MPQALQLQSDDVLTPTPLAHGDVGFYDSNRRGWPVTANEENGRTRHLFLPCRSHDMGVRPPDRIVIFTVDGSLNIGHFMLESAYRRCQE